MISYLWAEQVMIRKFWRYPEILILYPQIRYFHKNVNFHFLKKAIFQPLTSKIEFSRNWCYGYGQYVGFGSKQSIHNFSCKPPIIEIGHIGRFISKSKNHILKKKSIFLIENWLQRRQNGSDRKTLVVPSPQEHSLQTHKYHFWIREYEIFTYIFLDYFG